MTGLIFLKDPTDAEFFILATIKFVIIVRLHLTQ